MDFWIVAALITGLAAAALAVATLRRQSSAAPASDMPVYRDQLREVDRDLARGVITADEAERVRLEVSRRLLDADKAQTRTALLYAGASPLLAGILVVAVFGGTFWLYGVLGSAGQRDVRLATRLAEAEQLRLGRISQAEAEALSEPQQIGVGADPALVALLVKLRVALETRPDDLEGFELLARNEAGLGDFIAAHKALGRVIAIRGDGATVQDYTNYADLLVQAAGGYVSPEAEAAVRQVLRLDPVNGAGRFYLGLMNQQIGRPDITLGIWRQLLQESQPDDPWVAPIRAQIEGVAARAGVRFELEPLSVGPGADDIAAAADMSEEERAAFVSSMVAQLAARLASEGGPAKDWAQLITALGVLGQTDRATAIWDEAQTVFAGSPDDLLALHHAAVQAGIAP